MPKSGTTKIDLLEAAEYALRSRGFDGFSYADLSAAVGIRKASIHYHFPTKAILSEALMDRYSAQIADQCEAISNANPSASARLVGLIELYRTALSTGRTLCLCVAMTTSRNSLSEGVTAKINAFRAQMISWITSVFELAATDGTITGASHPTQEAHATLALLEGAHLAARAEENPAVFDRALAHLTARCNT
ncbi:MAG: TetR/AcrR family transcriptional regulator [Pseudomonadota bacterium]